MESKEYLRKMSFYNMCLFAVDGNGTVDSNQR